MTRRSARKFDRRIPCYVLEEFIGAGLILGIIVGCIFCSGCTEPMTPLDGMNATTPSPSVPEGRITPLFFTTLHDMQRILYPEINLALPHWLPNGYLFSAGTWLPSSEDGWREVVYQRGEEIIGLTQKPLNQDWISGTVNTTVGGEPAIFMPGEINYLLWSRYNLTFRLTASLSHEELITVAESVRPEPYDPGNPPPYDYVPPEHPLEKSFTVEQTISAHNLTVIFTTLDCSREECEAVFFVNLSSPPGASAPPGGIAPPRTPDPHGEFWVDAGTPLRTTQSTGYRPESNGTFIFWHVDPIPSDAGVLNARITRFGELEGPWDFTVPILRIYPETTGQPFFYDRELTVNTAAFVIRTVCSLSEEQTGTLRQNGVRRLVPSEHDTVYNSLIEENRVTNVKALGFVEDVYPCKSKEQEEEQIIP